MSCAGVVLVIGSGSSLIGVSWCIISCNTIYITYCISTEPLRGNEQPRPSSGSGTRGQVNKIIPTAIAILLVWARYILP